MNLIECKKIHSLEENLYMEFCYLKSPQLLKRQVRDDVRHIEDSTDRMIQEKK